MGNPWDIHGNRHLSHCFLSNIPRLIHHLYLFFFLTHLPFPLLTLLLLFFKVFSHFFPLATIFFYTLLSLCPHGRPSSCDTGWRLLIVVQLLSHVQLFVIPWTAACQASLSFTISWSLLKLILSIESVMLSNHLILCHPPFSSCPQSFLASGCFPTSQLFKSGGQSTGALASATVLPVNIQGWLPLRLAGLISVPSKGLSRVFSSSTIQKHQFFGAQPFLWSNSHIHTWLLENCCLA